MRRIAGAVGSVAALTEFPIALAGQPALELDLRGLKCPLPVLRTRKALAALASGTVLRVSCTDPLAAIDIPHLLLETGDTLLDHTAGAIQVFSIRKR